MIKKSIRFIGLHDYKCVIDKSLYMKFHVLIVLVFILVKLVDHLKHDPTNIKSDIIAPLTSEDFKKKSAQVKHVCLNEHQFDWESFAISAIESDYKKKTVFGII